MKLFIALIITSLAVSSAATLRASDRVNPFAPPIVEAPADADAPRQTRVRRAVRHPRLRGVLHAMEGSMANLNGHIIGVQESAMGYQLVAVQEHSADFVFRGTRVRLHVDNEQGTSTP
ncbi:MAG: hypothetical protein AB8B93_14245 [Pseudomonadales bacterium]